MTKDEFMAMSLGKGLKCIEPEFGLVNLNGITKGSFYIEGVKCNTSIHKGTGIKPILHPLSDLTKEIEHSGEKFVPLDKIREMGFYVGLDWIIDGFTDILNSAFEFVLKLIEWHFDICGLIEKGEAIDVNTLKINPYK